MKIESFSWIFLPNFKGSRAQKRKKKRKEKSLQNHNQENTGNLFKVKIFCKPNSKVLRLNFHVVCSVQESHDTILPETYIRPDNSSASKGIDLKMLRQTIVKSVGYSTFQ